MSGIEGIGEAVTGGMAARAVEPSAGGGMPGEGATCLNCGAGLIGDYCHRCGQSGHIHRTLKAFGHDIAHSVLHFDGKVWRTLPLLAWRPGELTRRYIEGERARFVSPMALFLFSVFMMFAVFTLLGGPLDLSPDTPAQDRAEAQREFQKERQQSLTQLRELEAELARERAAGENTASTETAIREVRREMALQDQMLRLEQRLANEEEARDAAQGEAEAGSADEPEINVFDETGWKPLDDAIAKAEKNPSLLLYKVQNNAYKFSWALIPISVPFLWLLFLHRRRYRAYRAYDHTVFVTYSIAFMSLGLIVLTLLRPLGLSETIFGLAISFAPPVHMYRQLRGAYQLSRWSALWRTFLLVNFAFIAGGLFLTLLLALGVLG